MDFTIGPKPKISENFSLLATSTLNNNNLYWQPFFVLTFMNSNSKRVDDELPFDFSFYKQNKMKKVVSPYLFNLYL